MPSNQDAVWHDTADGLCFAGAWLHSAVAKALPVIHMGHHTVIDVRAVSALDSSFMTVLLKLLAEQSSIRLLGVSTDMMALLHLYGLIALFDQVEGVA